MVLDQRFSLSFLDEFIERGKERTTRCDVIENTSDGIKLALDHNMFYPGFMTGEREREREREREVTTRCPDMYIIQRTEQQLRSYTIHAYYSNTDEPGKYENHQRLLLLGAVQTQWQLFPSIS